jgi:cell division septation protein DedD
MNNQRGGILSKLFIIPAGVALVVGFYFIGYYVGKYQNKTVAIAPPLPEIATDSAQKQEEFTFYKTLTDKSDKTVSIDVKPNILKEEINPEKQRPAANAQKSKPASAAPNDKRIEINLGKETPPTRSDHGASKQPQPLAKKEPAASSASAKLRYTVQTASYQERSMAEDEVKRLKKRGFAAFIVSSEIAGKGVRHRVRIGRFANRAAAEKIQKTIHEKERILTIVVAE